MNAPAAVTWTFLSNHAHVLLCIAQAPEIRLSDVARAVGITERAVQRIVADLEDGGYLTRVRSGRRNRYELHPERPLRHPIEAHRDVKSLLDRVTGPRGLATVRSPSSRSATVAVDRSAASVGPNLSSSKGAVHT